MIMIIIECNTVNKDGITTMKATIMIVIVTVIVMVVTVVT